VEEVAVKVGVGGRGSKYEKDKQQRKVLKKSEEKRGENEHLSVAVSGAR